MELKPLTSRQESRLVNFLDDAFLKQSREFETRTSPLARLKTIDLYFEALSTLHSLILTIPPIPPSASLRVAYYLQLTSLLPDALSGYSLDPTSPTLWSNLQTFDLGWTTIFNALEWDSRTGSPKPQRKEGAISGVRGTDRVRLESVILDVRNKLSQALHLPSFVPLKINPFADIVEPKVHLEGMIGENEEPEIGMSCAAPPIRVEEEKTPSLVGDGESTMDVDSVTSPATITSSSSMDDDDEEDEEDEDEFEEVDVDHPQTLTATDPTGDEDGFSISFTPSPLPPSLPTESVATEPIGNGRGFDPDEEYGSAEEEVEESYEEEVGKVFEETLRMLEEMKK